MILLEPFGYQYMVNAIFVASFVGRPVRFYRRI